MPFASTRWYGQSTPIWPVSDCPESRSQAILNINVDAEYKIIKFNAVIKAITNCYTVVLPGYWADHPGARTRPQVRFFWLAVKTILMDSRMIRISAATDRQ